MTCVAIFNLFYKIHQGIAMVAYVGFASVPAVFINGEAVLTSMRFADRTRSDKFHSQSLGFFSCGLDESLVAQNLKPL